MSDRANDAPGDGVGVIDDHHHIRDMVEPVTRSRMWEASGAGDFANGDSYEEWQLPGTDDGGEDGREEEEDGAVNEAFRNMLVSEPTATDDENDPRRRFVSFLCNPRLETRVLWLNRTVFLICEGPDTYTEADDGSLQSWLTQGNRHGYFSFYVQTADGRDYRFVLNSMSANHGEDDDDWATDLLHLFANSATVRKLTFDRVSQALLEAIVSRAPPPCGRTLDCRTFLLNEGAARVLAFQTHRDTELVLYLGDWFGGVPSCVPVLADAMRSNRCPRRLVLLETAMSLHGRRRDDADALADALRTTTGVEAITIQLSSSWPKDWGSSNLFLAAIGSNDGIRRLVVQQPENMEANRMADIWTRILVSRTIESVDATQVNAADEYTDVERRESALHVVSLMRSNRVLTELRYDAGTHDSLIMERRVVPFLDLNRFRSVVESWTAASGRDRTLSLLVGSPFVRGRPWLSFFVVKTNKEIFASKSSPLPNKRPTRSS